MTKKSISRLLQASLMCCLAVLFTACDDIFASEDNPTPAYLSMSDKPVTIKVGDTYRRKAISVTTAVVEYTSSDTKVATVDGEGVVTAIAEGTATITATATGYSTDGKKIYQPASVSYNVKVVPATVAVTSITLDQTTLNKKVGDAAVTLTATVKPDDATDKTLTWSSDKPAVATVADGVVTFVGAGTAIITAEAKDGSGIKTTCTVNVLPAGALAGVFSVSATKKVQFSKGNLQATWDGTSWTWAFAEHQWDYIGDAEGNTKITNSAPFVAGYSGSSTTVDLFGWVGASSTWTGVNQYGITSSDATSATDGYGITTENLKADWGTNMGTGWRTLTKDEWVYLFNTRTTTSGIRYAKATVNGKAGVILLPDDWSTSYYDLSTTAAYTANGITLADWTDKLEAHGAVFLPAAGYREVTTVNNVGALGLYWSSSYTDATRAYCAYFTSASLNPTYSFFRNYGFSVRLVRDVE